MIRWYVVSPKFDYTEIVCEFGGPTYEISDVVEVEANTVREAITKGVRLMEEWPLIARSDNKNPMAGCKAYAMCPVCCDEQMAGVDNWDCPVCGSWWRSNLNDNGSWDFFESGERYTARERNARIRRYLVEHPDYPS